MMDRYSVIASGGLYVVYDHEHSKQLCGFHRNRDARRHMRYLNDKELFTDGTV